MTNSTGGETRRPRILPPVGFVASLLAQGALLALNWPLTPGFLSLVVGSLCLVSGLLLNLLGVSTFRRVHTGLVPFTPATALVRQGPFRLTRNPMYLGMVLVSASVVIASGVWVNLFAPAAYSVWLHFTYILPEERFMESAFGQDYLSYRRSTSRWLGPI